MAVVAGTVDAGDDGEPERGKAQIGGGTMTDVERLRQVAVKRQNQGLVGMILTVDQVLALIARGDAQQLAYQLRIEDLEAEVARLRTRDMPQGGANPMGHDDLVRINDAAEQTGLPVSTIGNMVRRGAVYGERRPAVCADGNKRRVWFVDPDEVGTYAAMSHSKKIAAGREVS